MQKRSLIVALAAAALHSAPTPAGATPVVQSGPAANSRAVESAAKGELAAGLDALNRDDLAAAEAAFLQAAKADPKSTAAYIGLAEVAGRKGNAAQVESWLQKALAANPNDVEALRTWGRYLVRLGRFTEADTALKKAVSIDAKSVDARLDLADNELHGLKNPKAAEQSFRAATKLDETDVRALLGVAKSLAAQGKDAAAVAAFEQAAKVAPTDPRPTHLLARFEASRLKFDLALAALARTIAIDPGYLPAYLDEGDLYLGKGDVDRAEAAYRAGAKAAREPAMASFRLGKVLEAKAQWSEAEQAYLDAVKSDPQMYGAYNNLAFMAATRNANLDNGLIWAKKAIEIAPAETTLYDTLGWVHRARGELDPAAKAIERAVAANPKHPSFHYHLGVVYADQGRNKEAASELQKALDTRQELPLRGRRYQAPAATRCEIGRRETGATSIRKHAANKKSGPQAALLSARASIPDQAPRLRRPRPKPKPSRPIASRTSVPGSGAAAKVSCSGRDDTAVDQRVRVERLVTRRQASERHVEGKRAVDRTVIHANCIRADAGADVSRQARHCHADLGSRHQVAHGHISVVHEGRPDGGNDCSGDGRRVRA